MATQEPEQGAVPIDQALNAAWDATLGEEESTEETSETANTSEEAGGESDETQEVSTEAESTEEAEAETQEEETAEGDEPAKPTVEAPSDWPEDWQSKFATLESDEGRQLLIDQYKSFQADYTRKTQEIAEVRKAIEPIKEQLDLKGISEGQYIRQLTAADKYLSEKPVEALQWLMQNYGVSAEQISGQSDDYSDPEVSKLHQEINSLKQQIQQQTQQQQQASEDQVNQQVQQFATATDENGHLKHPDFDHLKPAMAGLIQSGHAKDLEDAYEQAAWADPTIREKRLEEQKRQATQETEKQRKEKAQKAKQASTPASSGTTGEAKEEPKDLRTELETIFDNT